MSVTLKTVVSQFLRLRLSQLSSSAGVHTTGAPVCVHFTDRLCGNPVRKKMDVKALQNEQFQRRMKKLNKELKTQLRSERIRKPIEEYEVRTWLKDDIASGRRVRKPVKYSEEEKEAQILLEKDWTRYRSLMFRQELRDLWRLQKAQQKALDNLREESEELYQQAIQIDENLLSYNFKGPVYTPPIEGYETGDGDYIDETNYFEKQEKFTLKRKQLEAVS